MPRPALALAVLPEDDLREAQLPLFAEGLVEAIEWTVDRDDASVPAAWWAPLLDHFAGAGALFGHGVHFSPLSAVFEPRQRDWLANLRAALARRPVRHLSEHLGFMTAPGVIRGAPMPVPFTPRAVAIGRDRLDRLADAARVPVGLENLALAMSRDDALAHGDLLEALLQPLDGFLVLDLHNLFCQAASFDLPADELLARMPLGRVREIHVSGGSWWTGTVDPARPFRRDTHDGPVPEEVFALLALALDRCPRAELVVLERLGGTLGEPGGIARYRDDFHRLRRLLDRATPEDPTTDG